MTHDRAKAIRSALLTAYNVGKAGGGKIIPHGDPQREANLARHMEGSKAPPVLYTGTSKDADFKKFNVPKNGTWFTTNPKNASDYAMTNDSQGFKLDDGFKYTPTNTSSRVIPVHLSAKNPKVYDPKEHNDLVTSMGGENYKRGQRILYDKLRQAGHDSVRIGDDTWVALGRPNQIKSAIGNRGTFDPNESDITKAGGGDVEKLPAEAGTSPIPEDHVRLYHQTSEENIPSILKSGLTLSRARGIEGPKAIYADEQGFYGKPGDAPTVEFSVPKERWKPPFVMGDVNPSDIIAHHVPWHRQARYILNHPNIVKEVMSGQHDDLTGDYKKAVDHVKKINKAEGGFIHDPEKAKRHALMIARGLHKAGGGDVEEDEDRVVPKPILFGEKPAYASLGGNGPPAKFTTTPEDQPDAPVFHSRVQELLKDPNSLGMMKMGTPHQWTKRLGQEGSKKEEMNWLELYQGKPNVKLSRQEMLARTVANLPKISNVVLGSKNGERDLSDIELKHGQPEIEEPDSSYISETAYENLQHDLHEFKNDPSFFGENRVKDGIKKFAENWLEQDPNDFDPKRLNNFLEESVNHGWIYPEEARRVLEGAAKNDIDPRHWSKIVDAISEKVSDNFNDPKKHGEDKLNQLSMISDLYNEPNKLTTHDYVRPLESAIGRLHDAKPKFMEELTDHLQDSLRDDYEELVRENYYNNGDAPTNRSVEVYHGDNQDTYYIREDTNGLQVEDPNGMNLGTVYSEDEAEHLIRSNFAFKYDMLSSTQKGSEKTKTESVPEPESDAKFDNSSYMLTGLKDYREEPITLEPKAGAFNLGHYPTNTLGHIRYGTVYDEQGNRLLHVDEAQSDWHQKGRDLGYDTPNVVANKQKAQKLLDVAREDLRNNRHHIGNSLGLQNPDTETTDRYAGLMLLDPENLDEHQKQVVLGEVQRQFLRAPEIAKQIFGEDVQDRLDRAGPFGQNQQAKNLLENFHNYSRTALGNDYRDNALSLNNVLQQHNDLKEQVRVGSGIPEAPWKQSADFAKLVFKKALRTAADHGYAGISLSPGWVQSHRWGGNKGHVSLYDDTFGGALGSVGKDLGLKKEYAKIPVLDEHAKKLNNSFEKDLYKKQGNRAQALYLTPESRRDIKKRGFELFKRGGMVEPYKHTGVIGDAEKAKRRALMIARGLHKAAGGDVEEDEEPNPRAVIGNNNPPPNVVKPTPGVKKWALPGQPTRDFDYTDPKTKKTTKHVFAVTDPNKDVNTKSLAAETNAALAYHLSLPQSQRIANSKAAGNKLAPYVGRDKNGSVKPFLTMNAKLEKAGQGYEAGETYEGASPLEIEDNLGVKTIGMPISPAYQHNKYKVCPNSASCKESCLGTTSGNYSNEDWWPQQNSVNKTHAFLSEPGALVVALHNEITKEKLGAEIDGKKLAVRMNVLSDTDPRVWEPLIKAHPDVDFYDYTKMNYDPIAPNHHYTYSSTGVSQPKENTGLDKDIYNPNQNWEQMRQRLDTGSNVAMVFTHNAHLPHEVHDKETGKKYRVIDGTTHDYRPLDKQPEGADGVIVGLRNLDHNKGRNVAAEKSKGFMVHYDPKVEMEPNKRTGEPTKKEVRVETGKFNKNGKPVMTTVPTNRTVEIAPQSKDFVPHNLREGRAHGGSVGDEMPQEYAIQQFHNFDKFDEPNEGPSAHQHQYAYGGPVEGDVVRRALNLTRQARS